MARNAFLRRSQSAFQQSLPAVPKRAKRREERFTFSIPIVVLGFNAGGRIFHEIGPTRNVSEHGCCFHLYQMPDRNSSMALSVLPREGLLNGHSHVLCEIAWLSEVSSGWDVGVHVLGDVGVWRLTFPIGTDK
jgi:PilZ domain